VYLYNKLRTIGRREYFYESKKYIDNKQSNKRNRKIDLNNITLIYIMYLVNRLEIQRLSLNNVKLCCIIDYHKHLVYPAKTKKSTLIVMTYYCYCYKLTGKQRFMKNEYIDKPLRYE